jgi:polygalacturonase
VTLDNFDQESRRNSNYHIHDDIARRDRAAIKVMPMHTKASAMHGARSSCCYPLVAVLLLGLAGRLVAVEVDVEAFGCKAGGKVCTREFNAAVSNVSAAGGGVLNVRGPGAYTVAGVEMKSHVTLVLHEGATINASRVLADWGPRRMALPECATGPEGEPPELEHGVLGGLFYASLAQNFTIRGCGALCSAAVNGGAAAWNGYGVEQQQQQQGRAAAAVAALAPPNPLGLIRSNMFVFSQCTDVVVEDLQIQDSSGERASCASFSHQLVCRCTLVWRPA